MLRLDPHRGVRRVGGLERVVPPHVAALGPRGVLAGAAHDEDVLDRRRLRALLRRERLVDRGLERGGRAAAVAAVGRDDELRLGVGDAAAQRVGGEPAEHHRVRGADARAREHRHDGLDDHREVDDDAVAGLDAEGRERVGRARDVALQLGVRDGARVARLALEVDRDPVAQTRLDVTVHRVVRGVERAVGEPARDGRLRPVEGLGERGLPRDEVVRLPRPEREPVGPRLLVQLGLRVRLRGELGARGEAPGLVEEVLQAGRGGRCCGLGLFSGTLPPVGIDSGAVPPTAAAARGRRDGTTVRRGGRPHDRGPDLASVDLLR